MWRSAILSVVVLLVACGSGETKSEAHEPNQEQGQDAEHGPAEHAVIVHFDYGNTDWAPFFEFEKTLETAISAAEVGEYDGNELAVDGSDGTLFMYGPNADKLFEVVKPRLESSKLLKNVEVTLRYGDADDPKARESSVRLGN